MTQQYQIITGKLLKPDAVISGDDMVDINSWPYRSMWSWLRLQYGRGIDGQIKTEVSEKYAHDAVKRHKAMQQFFMDMTGLAPKAQRKLQYIIDADGYLAAVASLNHLIIPEPEVLQAAEKIIGHKLQSVDGINGQVYFPPEQTEGFDMGLQVFAGSLNTRFAIKICNFINVHGCLNPLSFLGAQRFGRFGSMAATQYARVLRIKVKSELTIRLTNAIDQAKTNMDKLQGIIAKSKTIPVSKAKADLITFAMITAYNLGGYLTRQVWARQTHEAETQWGMAMAVSYIARHGEFESKSRQGTQMLGDISAAILLIDDIDEGYKKSLSWLKTKIKTGRLQHVDDLVKELALTYEQVQEYDLSPNPTKTTDTRARDYIAEYGMECWELDAIEPDELQRLVKKSVEKHVDLEEWEESLEQQETEKAELEKTFQRWRDALDDIDQVEYDEEEED